MAIGGGGQRTPGRLLCSLAEAIRDRKDAASKKRAIGLVGRRGRFATARRSPDALDANSVVLKYLPWLFGLVVLAALIAAVLHFGELQRFAGIARSARPQWLIVAVLLQAVTYPCTAAGWRQTLTAAASPLPMRTLVPLSLAKLFTDQAFPSVGLSGTVLLARGLHRRGVAVGTATQVLLVSLVSYYAAYLLATLAAILLLWVEHEASGWIIGLAVVFSGVAVAIPAGVLSLKAWGARSPPRWLARRRSVAELLGNITGAPTELLRQPALLIRTIALVLAVFLLDTMTLWAIFSALGQEFPLHTVFVGFMTASIVATIGPLPVGLGTFEASSVAMLGYLGVPVETALAGTLLLRGMTFWLPMLPGIWLARREFSAKTAEAPAHPRA